MKKFSWLLAVPLFFVLLRVGAAFAVSAETVDEAWVVLPAGAKPAYMGIHGGTMPVSLLVASDGACLLSFVGCTGNDFLEALRQGSVAPEQSPKRDISAGVGNASLFAGNATSSMPVVALSGDILAGLGARLQPFGLSDEPLSIEGQVARPEIFPARPPRSFSLADWLFPARKGAR